MMLRLLFIHSLFSIVLLQSCAIQPTGNIASSLFLKPHTEISRQRQVVISHLSHIGFYLNCDHILKNPDYVDNPLLKSRLSGLNKGATQAFLSTFSNYTTLDKPKSTIRSIDFIVHAEVIDMTLVEKTPIEHSDFSEIGEASTERENIPTDHLKIKLVLKDARSQKLIDVAYLQARSGILDYHKGYAAFVEYSIHRYLETITQ